MLSFQLCISAEVESRTQRLSPRPRTQKNPRPRTHFSWTYFLEAKDRNARAKAKDQEHNAQVFFKKLKLKERSSCKKLANFPQKKVFM